jgi:hypothetical protein
VVEHGPDQLGFLGIPKSERHRVEEIDEQIVALRVPYFERGLVLGSGRAVEVIEVALPRIENRFAFCLRETRYRSMFSARTCSGAKRPSAPHEPRVAMRV